MKIFKHILLFSILAVFLLSCEKTEGEGGTASIKGKVYVINYNSELTFIRAEYYGPDEDVYIVYGSDEVYSDKFSTHHDGTFLFKYLRKGHYTLYVYSKDLTLTVPAGVFPVEIKVEITEDGQEVILDDIVIIK